MCYKTYGTSTHSDRQVRPQTANSNSRRQNGVETKKPKPNVFIVLSQVVGEVGLVFAAKQVNGRQTRSIFAAVCEKLCDGSSRKTEERFGWSREAVAKGLLERSGELFCLARTSRVIFGETVSRNGGSSFARNATRFDDCKSIWITDQRTLVAEPNF